MVFFFFGSHTSGLCAKYKNYVIFNFLNFPTKQNNPKKKKCQTFSYEFITKRNLNINNMSFISSCGMNSQRVHHYWNAVLMCMDLSKINFSKLHNTLHKIIWQIHNFKKRGKILTCMHLVTKVSNLTWTQTQKIQTFFFEE